MLQIKHFVYNAFMENTYVLYDETKNCVIIDPGCYEQQEKNTLSTFIQKQGLTVVQLLNTHCHIDHVLGNQYIKTTYQTKLALHHLEEPILQATAIYAPQYGITNYELSQPDTLLKEGDQIKFGPVILDVLHVPGHSPGHMLFMTKKIKLVFLAMFYFKEILAEQTFLVAIVIRCCKPFDKKFFLWMMKS